MTPEERREARQRREAPAVVRPILAASMYVDVIGEDGVVGRYIFPGAGTLRGASAYCEQRLTDVTQFEAIAEDTDHIRHHLFRVGPNGGSFELELDVQAGTRLTVKGPPGCVGVFVGFLWQLGVA